MSNPLEKLFGDRAPPPKALAPQRAVPPIIPAPQKAAAAPTAKPEDQAAWSELEAEAASLDFYRPCATRPHPVLGFVIVEKNGTLHGFQYHTMRHVKHQAAGGKEYLTLSADGQVIGIEGQGLAILFRALIRHTLVELREYDGKPDSGGYQVKIETVEIADPRELIDGEGATLS